MLSIFSCAYWPSVFLVWRNVCLGLLTIFGYGHLLFLLSCMSCLYILESMPLLVASFANIFSHSMGCLFILFMVSFAVQKLISLIRSYLFLLLFQLLWETDQSLILFLSEKKRKLVSQSCPTLCHPVDCSLLGSSVHGIFQARILEWIAISLSRGSSQPRDQTPVSCITGRFFTV